MKEINETLKEMSLLAKDNQIDVLYEKAVWLKLLCANQLMDTQFIRAKVEAHDSDCAVHNMPAYPNGKCDCSFTARTDDGILIAEVEA